jgi:hypothetical protein
MDHQNARVSGSEAWSPRFVWTVWAAATALAFWATAVYGRWLPWSDDFNIVPVVTGDMPLSLAWLWEQHNEHRIPLVKLFFVGMGRLSGCDYRWTLAANGLLLSATAAALIVAARRLRGFTSWTDAVFPAVILHLGQGALGWAFHSQFLLTTVLSCLFVATAVAAPRRSVWRSAAMATGAVLLPLTGSSGLLVAAAATCLLAAEALGWNAAPGTRSPLARGFSAVGACLTCAIGIAYVATLHLTHAATYAGPWQTLVACLDTLSSYPADLVIRSPLGWRVGMAAAVIGTCAVAARAVWSRDTRHRGALVVLIGYVAALVLVALAVGYGRGTRDFTHLYGHYSTLALGVPVALMLVWAAVPQVPVARVVQAVLCIAALLVAANHAKRAIRNWGSGAQEWAVLATDMRGALSPEDVAARHAAALFFIDTPATRGMITTAIAALRKTTYPLYCTRSAAPHGFHGNDRTSIP